MEVNGVKLEAVAVDKDGAHFLEEMKRNKVRLEERVVKAEVDLEKVEPNSEKAGKIRSVIGKSRLLTTKKFVQFELLCKSNLSEKSGEETGNAFQTKNEDLAGFWDLVLLQVEDVDQLFDELKNSCSQTMIAPLPKFGLNGAPISTGSYSTGRRSSVSIEAPKKSKSKEKARDEARRKLLAEKRSSLKTDGCNANNELQLQIFAPAAPKE